MQNVDELVNFQDDSVAGVLAGSRGLPCLATGTRTGGALDMLEDVGRSHFTNCWVICNS